MVGLKAKFALSKGPRVCTPTRAVVCIKSKQSLNNVLGKPRLSQFSFCRDMVMNFSSK